MRTALLILALAAGACRGRDQSPAPAAEEEPAVSGALSPAGERHPGEIVNDDKVDGRVWTDKAADVPVTIAWVNSEGKWVPVVRIEITGTQARREIAKFGPDGRFLEHSLMRAPPR